jgi:hypothetical protein
VAYPKHLLRNPRSGPQWTCLERCRSWESPLDEVSGPALLLQTIAVFKHSTGTDNHCSVQALNRHWQPLQCSSSHQAFIHLNEASGCWALWPEQVPHHSILINYVPRLYHIYSHPEITLVTLLSTCSCTQETHGQDLHCISGVWETTCKQDNNLEATSSRLHTQRMMSESRMTMSQQIRVTQALHQPRQKR